MSREPTQMPSRVQSFSVLKAAALRVTSGVNHGEAMGLAEDVLLEDVYELVSDAALHTLTVHNTHAARQSTLSIHATSKLGRAGSTLAIDSAMTLMAPDGHTLELLVLVEVIDGGLEQILLLPLGIIERKTPYTLVGTTRTDLYQRLNRMMAAAFFSGTRITMASGEQRAVEKLAVGDRVLTRDGGAQEIRWIGQRTERANSTMAPVLIKKGVLNNSADLRISPHHRLFIYQRHDEIGTGRAEVMVQARHLINGTSVVQKAGGFADYYQLLFDQHHIIYAEGIAAESMQMDASARSMIPGPLAEALMHRHITDGPATDLSFEIAEGMLTGNTVELLRRASGG